MLFPDLMKRIYMSDKLKETRNYLTTLPMSELRSKAKNHYGIKFSRDDTKDDLINKIIGMLAKGEFAKTADGDLMPGWARIKLHPVMGVPNSPRYVDHNGYSCWIPVNVPVDVPAKLVEEGGSIRSAGEWKVNVNEYDENETSWEESLPMTIIDIKPGPDPKPGLELIRERKLQPKREFLEENGFWPSNEQFQEFMKSRRKVVVAQA